MKGVIAMNLFLKPDLHHALVKLYSRDRVIQTMKTLRDLERPRRYSAFQISTAWCVEVLKEAGFSDVRRIAHPADGKTAAYDFIMPQAWDLLQRSTLRITEPYDKIIADTDLSSLHAAEYSAPTPEGGVTAELVDAACLDPDHPDCKGKFVFCRGYVPVQNMFYYNMASAGCAGIVHFNGTIPVPIRRVWCTIPSADPGIFVILAAGPAGDIRNRPGPGEVREHQKRPLETLEKPLKWIIMVI